MGKLFSSIHRCFIICLSSTELSFKWLGTVVGTGVVGAGVVGAGVVGTGVVGAGVVGAGVVGAGVQGVQ